MNVARLIAFLLATTVCQSAFSLVVAGPPVVPQGASISTSLSQARLDGSPNLTQSGSGNGQVLDDGLGYATALYTGDVGSVVAKIRAGAGIYENVRASVTWFFTVVGPPEAATMPVYVPVSFQGHGRLSVQGLNSYYNHYEDADASAQLSSSLPGLGPISESLTNNGVNPFGLSLGGLALAFQSYSITLTVSTESFGVDGTAAVEADLDPVLEIGSDFAAEGYSLVSSLVPPLYGQTPAGSVPEPSTSWMMFAGGIGLLTVGVRRRGR